MSKPSIAATRCRLSALCSLCLQSKKVKRCLATTNTASRTRSPLPLDDTLHTVHSEEILAKKKIK
ncbi:hypothetical protein E2C01_062860 [Portunus trituberculatus]|uniref:Uncharacterized protein n=1 Tax=Portunus trituberculatus TaxID=210409 RepID=A0A5B7HH85_PORTR|nr:hypothetical protein [Portunus trituberculatus]